MYDVVKDKRKAILAEVKAVKEMNLERQLELTGAMRTVASTLRKMGSQ